MIALILGENAGLVLDDATKKLAERIQKELDEANKMLKVPVEVYPAITKNPPRLLEEDMLINSMLIRPGLIEVVFPLAEDLYMVSYFIMQKDCIIACCCLSDLLDFVKNGVERVIELELDAEDIMRFELSKKEVNRALVILFNKNISVPLKWDELKY